MRVPAGSSFQSWTGTSAVTPLARIMARVAVDADTDVEPAGCRRAGCLARAGRAGPEHGPRRPGRRPVLFDVEDGVVGIEPLGRQIPPAGLHHRLHGIVDWPRCRTRPPPGPPVDMERRRHGRAEGREHGTEGRTPSPCRCPMFGDRRREQPAIASVREKHRRSRVRCPLAPASNRPARRRSRRRRRRCAGPPRQRRRRAARPPAERTRPGPWRRPTSAGHRGNPGGRDNRARRTHRSTSPGRHPARNRRDPGRPCCRGRARCHPNRRAGRRCPRRAPRDRNNTNGSRSGIPKMSPSRGGPGLAPLDHAHLRRGAAHVEADGAGRPVPTGVPRRGMGAEHRADLIVSTALVLPTRATPPLV